MIISKTPYRISFFGGGTDYPAWYLKEGGEVLSTSIDKYCYISCRILPPFFSQKYRIVWSHIETVSSISEILHPAVREGLRYMEIDSSIGIEIQHQGDLPARAGMGSSSSFAVGLINSLTALQGRMIGRHELALEAIHLEQNVLKENVGSQDQVAAAHGGFNHIRFLPGGEIRVEPVIIPHHRMRNLESHLMMFYTGTSRLSSEVAGDVIACLEKKRDVLCKMKQLVNKAIKVLASDGTIEQFGHLLHENWQLKRSLTKRISNSTIDKIYSKARNVGAIGGKLLGAGHSGFMVFFVPPERQKNVREALDNYLHVPFKFEHEGSSIIFYNPTDCALPVEDEFAPHCTAAGKESHLNLTNQNSPLTSVI